MVLPRVILSAAAAAVLCLSPAGAAVGQPAAPFRACGSFTQGAPNHVYATPNVPCSQARDLMRQLFGGSTACARSGFIERPRCVLEGFHCSAHPIPFRRSQGDCVRGARRVRGEITH